MRPEDQKPFVEALAGVYALYRFDLSESVIAIWWRALQGYELAAVIEALGRHSMNPDTGQFLPKPADVVKAIEGATQDVALIAWNKVLGAVKQHGTYESVVFDDPIINRVLTDLGGWIWFGQQTEKEMPFVERRFRDAYRAWRARGIGLCDPVSHLPGVFEAKNSAHGFLDAVPEPRFIGTRPAKALSEKNAPKLRSERSAA